MSWIEWTVVMVAAAALVFVLAELAARAGLHAFGRYFVWTPGSRMRLLIDGEALPALEPVAEHWINRDGERGDEPPKDAQGTYRVLVAGGSAAECYFLDQRSSWPSRLQDALSRPENLRRLGAERVHVGNVARSLVTCRHIDGILERILPRYEKLDAIVFMVGASDVVHWMERGAPARIEESPIAATDLFARNPEPPFGWSPRTLALRRIASVLRNRLMRPIEVREKAGKRLKEVRAMRQAAQEIVTTAPDPAPLVQHFERWFERLVRRAQTKARTVLVVRQPWLEKQFTPQEERQLWSYGMGRPYQERVTRYFAHEVAWQLLRAVDAKASEVARRLGAHQVELMSRIPADFTAWYDETHNTPAGCKLVGEMVAEALAEAQSTPRGADATASVRS